MDAWREIALLTQRSLTQSLTGHEYETQLAPYDGNERETRECSERTGDARIGRTVLGWLCVHTSSEQRQLTTLTLPLLGAAGNWDHGGRSRALGRSTRSTCSVNRATVLGHGSQQEQDVARSTLYNTSSVTMMQRNDDSLR